MSFFTSKFFLRLSLKRIWSWIYDWRSRKWLWESFHYLFSCYRTRIVFFSVMVKEKVSIVKFVTRLLSANKFAREMSHSYMITDSFLGRSNKKCLESLFFRCFVKLSFNGFSNRYRGTFKVFKDKIMIFL